MRVLLPRLLLLALCACSSGQADETSCGPTSGVVSRVIDGDTCELASGEHVRLVMVDAPENTQGHDECYGAEARAFHRALVEGRGVTLRYDAQCADRYGRLLAYVSADGKEVNATLVERGYACVLHIPPNGDGRVPEFQALERAAREAGRGFWGRCEPVPCR